MSKSDQPAGVAVDRGVGRPVDERTGSGMRFRWLVEEFANGNSTGRYMMCPDLLTTTTNPSAARQYLRMRTALFRAHDMMDRHGGDWRPTHHGFAAEVAP